MTCLSNPVYDDPESERTATVLKDEKLIPVSVAVDTHMTESAALADLVLPAATFLESWDLDLRESCDRIPVLSLRQPVVRRVAETEYLKAGMKVSSPPFRPFGDAVSLNDLFLELGKRIGGPMDDLLSFDSTTIYLKRIAAPYGNMETLQRDGVLTGPRREYNAYERQGFNTPSGKCEIFSETLERQGYSPLPVFTETPIHRRSLDGGQVILTTYMPVVHTNRTGNCKWLAEIIHDNPVWINTETAASLDLKEGDRVRITSAVGTIETMVHLTEGMHPRTIAMAQGCGHREWGSIARAEMAKSSDPDTTLMWWSKQGNGVHPNTIIPVLTDPCGGGQAWHETLVTIEKI
ncbi:MAG: molybdopterin-dependent oxidoreductase [Deltaproteobacteria bacterium]|nr:molybdopterin-dependent oxidoreductase [Deltaproteobacteria bacterium]